MKTIFLLLILSLASFAQDVLTNDGVIEMVKAGLSPSLIKKKVESTPSRFDTSTPALLKLTDAKVPEEVVIAMMEKESASRKQNAAAAQAPARIVEQGRLSDLKGRTRVFIDTDLYREWIVSAMEKAGFKVVDSEAEAEFAIVYIERRESGGGWSGNEEQKVGYFKGSHVRIMPGVPIKTGL